MTKIRNEGEYRWIIPRQLKNGEDIALFEKMVMENMKLDSVHLGIDFSELRFLSIVALGRVVEVLQKISLNEKKLLLVCSRKEVRHYFEKMGITRYWQIYKEKLVAR